VWTVSWSSEKNTDKQKRQGNEASNMKIKLFCNTIFGKAVQACDVIAKTLESPRSRAQREGGAQESLFAKNSEQ
jgi:hypothetical protein